MNDFPLSRNVFQSLQIEETMDQQQLACFKKEVLDKGPQALLPQNLCDKWLDALMDEATFFLDQFLHETDPKNNDSINGLLLAVLKILASQQAMVSKGISETSTEELIRYIHIYSLIINLQSQYKKGKIPLKCHPTIDNIFSDDGMRNLCMEYFHPHGLHH